MACEKKSLQFQFVLRLVLLALLCSHVMVFKNEYSVTKLFLSLAGTMQNVYDMLYVQIQFHLKSKCYLNL